MDGVSCKDEIKAPSCQRGPGEPAPFAELLLKFRCLRTLRINCILSLHSHFNLKQTLFSLQNHFKPVAIAIQLTASLTFFKQTAIAIHFHILHTPNIYPNLQCN